MTDTWGTMQSFHDPHKEPPMRRARFLTSAASILTIAGGALLLGTPRDAAAFAECSFRQLETAEEVTIAYCEYGGDADVWCNPDGSMAMIVYCYN